MGLADDNSQFFSDAPQAHDAQSGSGASFNASTEKVSQPIGRIPKAEQRTWRPGALISQLL